MMLRIRRLNLCGARLPGIPGLPGLPGVVGADFLTDIAASNPVTHLLV
tara:strand:+ start:1227 stop:1370 length:144 start_codon:yes stop_codon:yes gene_type:complete